MNFNDLSRNELLIVRSKCDDSLLFFTRFWFRVLKGAKFITNWHHDQICSELRRIEKYELELLNINIPPRFSKTEIAAVNFIARGIGMNPESNWLYITASDELRAQTSVSIRDIVSHPYFKIMYGVELKKDQNTKNLWRTLTGGGLKTATVSGQITGFGAGQMIDHSQELEDTLRGFEGCIVLDDINKTDDSEQENANNDKVTRVIFNTILSRKNSSDTPIINIQQRSGMADATAQFKEHYKDDPKTKFLIYPVLYEGKPLWPYKHNMEAIEKLKNSVKTAKTYETQYMQNPQAAEGLMFPELKTFKRSELTNDGLEAVIGYMDVKDEGDDYLCAVFGKVYKGKVFITDVIFNQDTVTTTVPQTAAKINELKANYTRVEKNNAGGGFIRDLRKLVGNEKVLAIHSTTHKLTRIWNEQAFITQNCYVLAPGEYPVGSEYDLFIQNVMTYRKDGTSKVDDAPDAFAGLSKMAQSFYPSLFIS